MKTHLTKWLFKRAIDKINIRPQLHTVRMLKGIKVKLVAVAKNESPYLAEWIYHHLYFGFAQIEIHFNQCSDNTVQLLRALGHPSVSVINADAAFDRAVDSPQVHIYRKAFDTAWHEGYTHIMFLDIDEFWLPTNLQDSISKWVGRQKKSDVLCFNWLNKTNEGSPFSSLLSEPTLDFEAAEQVKSLYKTLVKPVTMNPHNVIDSALRYNRDNGEEFKPINTHYSRTTAIELPFSTDRAVVIHRKYRSEHEYLALLGRGRPIGSANCNSIFKDNRDGYINEKPKLHYRFNEVAFCNYRNYMHSCMSSAGTQKEISLGREFVEQRYKDVIALIANAPVSEKQTLNRLLKNVKDPQALHAWKQFKTRHTIN